MFPQATSPACYPTATKLSRRADKSLASRFPDAVSPTQSLPTCRRMYVTRARSSYRWRWRAFASSVGCLSIAHNEHVIRYVRCFNTCTISTHVHVLVASQTQKVPCKHFEALSAVPIPRSSVAPTTYPNDFFAGSNFARFQMSQGLRGPSPRGTEAPTTTLS